MHTLQLEIGHAMALAEFKSNTIVASAETHTLQDESYDHKP